MPTEDALKMILSRVSFIEADAINDRVQPVDIVAICHTVRSLVSLCEKQEALIKKTGEELRALQDLVEHDERRNNQSRFQRLLARLKWVE